MQTIQYILHIIISALPMSVWLMAAMIIGPNTEQSSAKLLVITLWFFMSCWATVAIYKMKPQPRQVNPTINGISAVVAITSLRAGSDQLVGMVRQKISLSSSAGNKNFDWIIGPTQATDGTTELRADIFCFLAIAAVAFITHCGQISRQKNETANTDRTLQGERIRHVGVMMLLPIMLLLPAGVYSSKIVVHFSVLASLVLMSLRCVIECSNHDSKKSTRTKYAFIATVGTLLYLCIIVLYWWWLIPVLGKIIGYALIVGVSAWYFPCQSRWSGLPAQTADEMNSTRQYFRSYLRDGGVAIWRYIRGWTFEAASQQLWYPENKQDEVDLEDLQKWFKIALEKYLDTNVLTFRRRNDVLTIMLDGACVLYCGRLAQLSELKSVVQALPSATPDSSTAYLLIDSAHIHKGQASKRVAAKGYSVQHLTLKMVLQTCLDLTEYKDKADKNFKKCFDVQNLRLSPSACFVPRMLHHCDALESFIRGDYEANPITARHALDRERKLNTQPKIQFVFGEYGTGKSSLVWSYVNSFLNGSRNDKLLEQRVPFALDLSGMASLDRETVFSTIMIRYSLSREDLEALAYLGRLWFLLDGIEEMQSGVSLVENVCKLTWIAEFNCNITVFTRRSMFEDKRQVKYVHEQHFKHCGASVEFLYLRVFTPDEVKVLVSNVQGLDTNAFFDRYRNKEAWALVERPAYTLAFATRFAQNSSVEFSYQEYMEHVVGRNIAKMNKALPRELSVVAVYKILIAFAILNARNEYYGGSIGSEKDGLQVLKEAVAAASVVCSDLKPFCSPDLLSRCAHAISKMSVLCTTRFNDGGACIRFSAETIPAFFVASLVCSSVLHENFAVEHAVSKRLMRSCGVRSTIVSASADCLERYALRVMGVLNEKKVPVYRKMLVCYSFLGVVGMVSAFVVFSFCRARGVCVRHRLPLGLWLVDVFETVVCFGLPKPPLHEDHGAHQGAVLGSSVEQRNVLRRFLSRMVFFFPVLCLTAAVLFPTLSLLAFYTVLFYVLYSVWTFGLLHFSPRRFWIRYYFMCRSMLGGQRDWQGVSGALLVRTASAFSDVAGGSLDLDELCNLVDKAFADYVMNEEAR